MSWMTVISLEIMNVNTKWFYAINILSRDVMSMYKSLTLITTVTLLQGLA